MAVNLKTPAARSRLKPRDAKFWTTLAKGVAVGWRRHLTGYGTWYARRFTGERYAVRAIGTADDVVPADGDQVLDYEQAARKALARQTTEKPGRGAARTVADAATSYFKHRAARSRSAASVATDQSRYDSQIAPNLGPEPLTDLTTQRLRRWRDALVADAVKDAPDEPERREQQRQAQATANRCWTILRAILNHAFEEGAAADDTAWRRIKPYKNVDRPRKRVLATDECVRLINAAEPAFRQLVRGALMTGLRQGELLGLKAADFRDGRIHVSEGKSGKPRTVPLSAEGATFFEQQTAGKDGAALMFADADGAPWIKMRLSRRMGAAIKAAKISPPAVFHDLRRSYGSLLVNAGTSMETIRVLLGHSDLRMTARAYAHLQDQTVADAVQKRLPKFGLEKTNVRAIGAKRKEK